MNRIMRHNKLVSLLLLVTVFFSFTGVAEAQLGGVLGSRVPTILIGEKNLGIINEALDGIVDVALTSAVGLCLGVTASISANQSAAQGIDGLALITNNATLITRLNALAGQVTAAISACGTASTLISGMPETSLVGIQKKNVLAQRVATESESLKVLQDQVNTQLRIANQGFYKALIVYVLLNVSKQFTTSFLEKGVKLFSSTNAFQHIQNLASLAYDVEGIYKATGDKREQLALHTILNSPEIGGRLNPSAVALAQSAINLSGINPKEQDFEDDNYYSNQAQFGQMNFDPFGQDLSLRGIANTVRNQSLTYASKEFQDNIKTPRNCNRLVSEQDKIRKDYEAFQLKLEALEKQNQQLEVAYKNNPGNISFQDVYASRLDRDEALAQMNEYATGLETPVIKFCQIASPATMVRSLFDKVGGEFINNINDYKPENLPSVLKLVGDITSGAILNKILLPGSGSNNKTIGDTAKTINGSDAAGLSTTIPEVEAIEKEGAIFTYSKTGNENEIRLQWTLPEGKKVASVKLQGPGVGADAPTKLNAEYVVTVTAKSKFQLLRFDDKGVQLNKILEVKVPFPVKNPADVNSDGDSGTTNDGSAPDGGPGATTNNDQSVLGAFDRAGMVLQTRGEIRPRN